MMYQTNLKFKLVLIGELRGIEHAREVRDLLGGDYYVDYLMIILKMVRKFV